MGLFGFGKKKESKKGSDDFLRRLKNEPRFMLTVLRFFDGNPALGTIVSKVKAEGYDLSANEILSAMQEAVEHYEKMQSGGSSGNGLPSGFSQNGGGSSKPSGSSSGDDILAGFKQVSQGTTPHVSQPSKGSAVNRGNLRSAKNATEQVFLDMIGNPKLHAQFERIVADKDVKLGVIVERLQAAGYPGVDVLELVTILKDLGFQYDDDNLCEYFKA